MTVPRWDQHLDPAEARRLAPRDRGRRAIGSLERKIEAIEREASRPCEARRKDIPTDRAKLRRWESVEERLWAWSDPLFDSPTGRNTELMRRFAVAIGRLRAKPRSGTAALRDDLREAERRMAAMVRQVADLIGQNHMLRVALRQAQQRRT